jgi:hypothetical protein
MDPLSQKTFAGISCRRASSKWPRVRDELTWCPNVLFPISWVLGPTAGGSARQYIEPKPVVTAVRVERRLHGHGHEVPSGRGSRRQPAPVLAASTNSRYCHTF